MMKTTERKTYYKNYYLKNREKMLDKAKARQREISALAQQMKKILEGE